MSGVFSLHGKKGLILGIANAQSIAFGCARAAIASGAVLAVNYQNEKSLPFVRAAVEPWIKSAAVDIFEPCDLLRCDQIDRLFDDISRRWGRLDFVIHSVAFAPQIDLHGRVLDCSRDGFLTAMDVSCYSLVKIAKMAEPLMTDGGSIVTMSYYGGEKVVPEYNLMGPVKAALDAVVRELASEMGGQKIRVNAIAPGPIFTRAASGIANFQNIASEAVKRSPEHRLATIDEVGGVAVFLVSEASRAITGTVTHVDAGYHIMA